MRTPLLVPEPPLQLLRSLAKEIGLNEAIVLQQVHYRQEQSGDGWVRRTYREWAAHDFPFWGERTVERIFVRLREKGLIQAGREDGSSLNRALRYRVDHSAVPSRQFVGVDPDNLARQSVGMSKGEIEESSSSEEDVGLSASIDEIFSFWKATFGLNGNAKLTPERRRKVRDRLKQGYTVARIKRAVEGCAGSDHHRKGGFNDLELICRTGAKLEWFEAKPLNEASAHQAEVQIALDRGPELSEDETQAQLAKIGLGA